MLESNYVMTLSIALINAPMTQRTCVIHCLMTSIVWNKKKCLEKIVIEKY